MAYEPLMFTYYLTDTSYLTTTRPYCTHMILGFMFTYQHFLPQHALEQGPYQYCMYVALHIWQIDKHQKITMCSVNGTLYCRICLGWIYIHSNMGTVGMVNE